MTPEAKRKLRKSVSYFGLQVKYVTGLPDKVFGVLQSGSHPSYILINARKSRLDHVFTIAHELGHYVMHHNRPLKKIILPWYLDYPWKSKFIIEVTQMTKNWVLPIFDREWEADAWAFIYLWRIGAGEDLIAFTKIYPDKKWMVWVCWAAAVYLNLKQISEHIFQRP